MYEDFYGLTGKAFQLSPDPAFFYGSKGHNSAFSYFKYGVYQGEGFLVITGEIGAGKTTIVRALLEELDVRAVVAAQIVSTQLDANDLLRAVAKAFGIGGRQDDKAHLIASLEAFLLTLFQQNKRALLIVDEAQNLSAASIEELRMLSNFQCGEQALLQSFLVGQPELRNLLRLPIMEQFRQRVIASFHLGPLDHAETRAYIEHRLHRVAWKNDPEFEADAFHAIHVATGGVPRRINSLCNRLLLASYLAGKHVIKRDDVSAIVEEVAHELGPDLSSAVTAPTRLPSAVNDELADTPSQLKAISDRVAGLERNVDTLLTLVRGIIEPERALPEDEPVRQEPLRRKRKPMSAT